MPTITINDLPVPPGGKDVAIRRKPISGMSVQAVLLENFYVAGWSTGKAVHVSATETINDRHYDTIHLRNGVVLNTKFLVGSHCDGIKIDFGTKVSAEVILENILVRGGESGVMPIHIADGILPGPVTLRNVQVEDYHHPVHVGRSGLSVPLLQVENCPGIQITGRADRVVVHNSPGAVIFGETYGPTTPPVGPPPPPLTPEQIEQLKRDILLAQKEIERLTLERDKALQDAKRTTEELVQLNNWVDTLDNQLIVNDKAIQELIRTRP